MLKHVDCSNLFEHTELERDGPGWCKAGYVQSRVTAFLVIKV